MTFKRLIKGKVHLYPLHPDLSQSNLESTVQHALEAAYVSSELSIAQIWDIAAILHKFAPSESLEEREQGSDDEDKAQGTPKQSGSAEAGGDENEGIENGSPSPAVHVPDPSVCTSPFLTVSLWRKVLD